MEEEARVTLYFNSSSTFVSVYLYFFNIWDILIERLVPFCILNPSDASTDDRSDYFSIDPVVKRLDFGLLAPIIQSVIDSSDFNLFEEESQDHF